MRVFELTQDDLARCVGGASPVRSTRTVKGPVSFALEQALILVSKGIEPVTGAERRAFAKYVGDARVATSEPDAIDPVAQTVMHWAGSRQTNRLRFK
jgi:hypothetical protein